MSLTVIFDGQDISDQIIGSVNVRREERAAGQADFVWSPDIEFPEPPPPPPQCPQLFLDNLTDTDGVLLEDHLPDSGPPNWVKSQGQATIRDAATPAPQGADFRNDGGTNTYSVPLPIPVDLILKWRFYTSDLSQANGRWLFEKIVVGFAGSNTFVVRGLNPPDILDSAVINPGGGLVDVELEITVTTIDSTAITWEVAEVDGAVLAAGTADATGYPTLITSFLIQTVGSFVLTYVDIQNCRDVDPSSVTGARAMREGASIMALSGTPALPYQLIRKPVQIFWDGESIFNGFVNDAVWNLYDRVYEIDCSDLFQEIFEGLTVAQITGLIPGGLWSEAVFGLDEDGWSIAQDVMSTVALDVHKNRSGIYSTAPWEAKATADLSLTEAQILNGGAYSLDLAKARDLITQFRIELSYEYSRWKMRLHEFNWTYTRGSGVTNFCDYLTGPLFQVPGKETVMQAASGTGWPIYYRPASQGISIASDGFKWTLYPEGGDFCGGPLWAIDEYSRQLFAMGASWTGYKLFAQTIKEQYDITLAAVAAQALYGVVSKGVTLTAQVESDDAVFEQSATPPDVFIGAWAQDRLGDWRRDQDDEAVRVNDLECAIGLGSTTIKESLRGNDVSVEIAIDPTIDLDLTVKVTTRDIEVKGKLRALEHRIDLSQAVTRLTIAVSAGEGGTDGDLSAPARPNTNPTHTAPETQTLLPTRLGGCGNSPPFDDTWDGWSTNYRVCTGEEGGPPTESEQVYPYRFKVTGPDIEDEAREDFEAPSVSTIEIAVPRDTLILS